MNGQEVLTHLFKDVLEIKDDAAKAINDAGTLTYGRFKQKNPTLIDDLLADGKINPSDHGELVALKKYIKVHSMSSEEAEKMTSEYWFDIDRDLIELKFNQLPTSLSTTTSIAPTFTSPPTTAILTPTTITTSDILATNFLKYSSIKLNDKDSILNFYDAIQTQGIQYRIFLRPSNQIDGTHGVKPDGISIECSEMTSTTIYTKLCQENIIDTNYKNALSIRDTTKCGYQFLQLLLYQAHPQLLIHSIAIQNIPKYSTTSNLYSYAKSMVVFIRTHELKRRKYSLEEQTAMYLAHLDDPRYEKAILTCQMALTGCDTPPTEYTLPAIAGTIDQLCPIPTHRNCDHVQVDNRHPARANATVDNNDTLPESHYDDVENSYGEPGYIHAFRDTANRSRNPPKFSGTCNACGAKGHHAKSCYFLMKLRKALGYLKLNPQAIQQTQNNFRGKHSFQKNKSYARALQDANFIPYGDAPSDIFVDVVDDDHTIFAADLLDNE